jgi:GNAT superfamily N-acetyltransferase
MIRKAVHADEASVRACAEDAYARYVGAIGRKPAPMIADFAAQISRGWVFVEDDETVGVAGYVVFFPRGDAMFLENVAVRPARQGCGLGRRLIAFCEAEAARLNLAAVELYTNEKMTGNLSLYPRLGYVETGRRTENGFNRVYFRKPFSDGAAPGRPAGATP